MNYRCSECGSLAEIIDMTKINDDWFYVLQCTNDLDMFESGACALVYNGCTELLEVKE